MDVQRPIPESETSYVALCTDLGLFRKGSLMRSDCPEEGDHVRVHGGVFAGVEGTVERRLDGSRLLLALHLVQRGVSLAIDADLITAVPSTVGQSTVVQ